MGEPVEQAGQAGDALQRAFRDCAGEFATGVTVVNAEAGDQRAGLTLNSFTSVSLEPLLILISLGLASRTRRVIGAAGRFSVSILARDQRDVALAFAERDAPFAEQYVERVEGALVVRGAVATLR